MAKSAADYRLTSVRFTVRLPISSKWTNRAYSIMNMPTSKSTAKEVATWLKEARAALKAVYKEYNKLGNQSAATESYSESLSIEMKMGTAAAKIDRLESQIARVLDKHLDRILEAV